MACDLSQMKAILCHLANQDSISASQANNRFDNLDYTFGESREGKFASQLIEATGNFDAEGFAASCFEYDRISKLDPWKTSMLVKVKRGISDDGGVGGEDDEGKIDITQYLERWEGVDLFVFLWPCII
jgi:alpha-soluble NSF attachment protein